MTNKIKKIKKEKIKSDITKYLKKESPVLSKLKKIPYDKSLLQLGYIDSFGVIGLISFIEKKFLIKFKENDINLGAFRSLNNVCDLVYKKIK